MLVLSGGLATIDPMGCQTAIAEAVATAGADHVPAVKENQPTLHAGIEAYPEKVMV